MNNESIYNEAKSVLTAIVEWSVELKGSPIHRAAKESLHNIQRWHTALSLPSEADPVGEIRLFGGMKEVSWKAGKLPDVGTKLYAALSLPRQSEAVAWQFRFADRWADCTLQEFNRFQQNSPLTAATETRALYTTPQPAQADTTPAAQGVGDDTKLIDWLEANEADLCLTRQLENEGGEYSVWWNVIGELGSISGHPLACPREAIYAAMLQAASAPGGE